MYITITIHSLYPSKHRRAETLVTFQLTGCVIIYLNVYSPFGQYIHVMYVFGDTPFRYILKYILLYLYEYRYLYLWYKQTIV